MDIYGLKLSLQEWPFLLMLAASVIFTVVTAWRLWRSGQPLGYKIIGTVGMLTFPLLGALLCYMYLVKSQGGKL